MPPKRHSTAEMAEKLAELKQEFAQTYNGGSHIQEIIPHGSGFPAERGHIRLLHEFASQNPIYHNSYEQSISGTGCTIYEGDINSYWLDSIKHGSSCQPFYPTWVLSAYIIALHAKNLGCGRLVDIGSGDGRIAYCGSMLGLPSYSIEIDRSLVELQAGISESTGVDFERICEDATVFDYSSAMSDSAAFFIGGLPQMGGDILASSAIEKILKDGPDKPGAVFVFAGSHSRKGLAANTKNAGWYETIKRYNLRVVDTVTLPTVWTFDQPADTPYMFAKLA